MNPLVLDGGLPQVAFWILTAGWLLGEGWFALQTTMRHAETRDPSEVALTLSLVGGLMLGVAVAGAVDSLALPGPRWWPPLAGFCVFAAGIALRVWAVRTLGLYFRYTIVLAALGVGIALGNWLAIAACLIPPLVGFSIRLLHEERVLAVELGEPYRAYMRRTRRLIPGVW
jgi:protein-S-isoprenylcysteine O-methyltransferase Ste14